MFIKRVEIFGFKSFKNKTVLEFDDHEITGIVGPNGCGKSNVVDALLWVMGENSPKQLRGESLSDIIFSGTTKEPQGKLAEVSLTLNKGDTGFPEKYKDFSEMMITRRSYRDGKSEYLINQQVCLLKEIKEFFMNTGAGCRGFSIIEQESIERLITAKPIQRRFIIEEVAGISKFKNRKNESVRKLDLVNQNLQRLDDILKMQESQLNKLTSQAKKAEKYRELKKEIEIRQEQIEKREKEDMFCAYQSLSKQQDSLKTDKLEKEQKNQYLEKQIEKEKILLEQIRQEQIEKKIEESGLLNKVKAFEMIEGIKQSKTNLKEKEVELCKELSQLESFFKGKKDIEEFEKEEKQIKNHLDEIKHNKKDVEVNINMLQKQRQFIEKEEEALTEEEQSIKTQLQKNINDKNKINSLLQKQEQMSLNFDKELSVVLGNEKILLKKKEEIKAEVNALNQRVSILKHKIEEMKKLIFRFENINQGASDLAKWKPEEFSSLFQNLKAEPDYAAALGSVLGHHIQALIPKEDISLKEAIKRLKNSNKGRTSFLSSLPGVKVSESLKKEVQSYPAFVCFLEEKLKWNLRTESLRSFLGQTVVVSDLNSAFELKKQFPAFQFVTKEGDLITRDSFVYAGSSDKETSLFQIRDQVDEHTKELASKEIELKVKTVDLESCVKQLNQTQKTREDMQSKNTQSSGDLIVLQKDRERMEKDILRLSDSRKKNNEKKERFEEDKKTLIQHDKAYQKELEDLEDSLTSKESRIKTLQISIDEYKTQELKRTQWERELFENNKDQQALDQKISLLLNLTNKNQNLEEGKKDFDQKSNLEKEIALIYKKKEKLDENILSFQKELESQNQLKEKQEKNIKEFEKQFFQLKKDINDLELNWNNKELEKTYLQQKFLEKYKLQIEDFVLPSSLEELSLEKIKSETEHYLKQLDRIKEVNFLALEEYEKLSKENFFLNTQKEDLVNSKKELKQVISHIDKLCENRFKDMLEEINKRFSRVFPIVFQGDNAKAQLILHKDSEGKEEDGVDILVHPPGKKPQSVSLLSRGEKALTSVCLIYSLFLVKPSPFCIIDEADAPLDDANIHRFLSILKEMSRKSQIIAITHNKYTMQNCKKLYGVTMERPGISQIVSVDMQRKDFSSFVNEMSID